MGRGPYTPRMTRVSPPELARELPGPQASTSVTRAPPLRSDSAENAPNTPAPTTTTRGPGRDGERTRVAARLGPAAARSDAAESPRRRARRDTGTETRRPSTERPDLLCAMTELSNCNAKPGVSGLTWPKP